MAHTQFTCPECGTTLKLSVPVSAGTPVRCPKCKRVFRPGASPPPAAAVKRPVSPAPSPPVKRTAPPAPAAPVRRTAPPPPLPVASVCEGPPAKPHAPPPRARRVEDDHPRTGGGRKRASKSKAPLVGGLIGIGSVLVIVGVVMAVKFSGDGDKKDDQHEEKPIVEGKGPPPNTPGGNEPRPDLPGFPIDQTPQNPPSKPGDNKPPEKPPAKPQPDWRPDDRPPARPPLAQKDPDDAVDLPPPKSLADDKDRPLLTLDARGHTARSMTVLFTPDAKQVITAGADKTVRIWDVASGETVKTIYLPVGTGAEGALDTAALSPNCQRLAVTGLPLGRGAFGILIYILSPRTGQIEKVLKGQHRQPVETMIFARDGRTLYTSSFDKVVRAIDVVTGHTARAFEGHRDRVRALALSPDGRWLATGCN